jgi:disulfide bond formation protein DsbB
MPEDRFDLVACRFCMLVIVFCAGLILLAALGLGQPGVAILTLMVALVGIYWAATHV